MSATVYTSSPIEAHVIAVFLKAQTAMASFFKGTPVLRGLLFAALTWAVLRQFLRIASSRSEANQAIIQIAYRVGMVFLSVGLLSWATEGLTLSGVDGAWSQYSAVQSDTRYQTTLNGSTTALWSYALIYQALDGISQASVAAAASAFSDEALKRDPMFVVDQLERMGSFTISPETQAALVPLIQGCVKTDTGQVVPAANSIEGMFDLAKDDCQARWDAFKGLAEADGTTLIAKYPDYIRQRLEERLSSMGIGDEQLSRVALSMALDRASRDLLSASAAAAKEPEAASATIQPDVGVGFLGRVQEMNPLAEYQPGEQDEGATGWQHMKLQFEAIAPFIPAARGYIQGILAVLFVVAVYTLGFGTWRFMKMWLLAEATICFYKPVALLGYKVSEYFLLEDAFAQAMKVTGANGLVLGGARVLHEQMARIQTVYVAFELGAFLTFCLGAVAVFRSLGNLAWMGGRAMSAQSSAASAAQRASGNGDLPSAGTFGPPPNGTAVPGVYARAQAAAAARGGADMETVPVGVGGTGVQPAESRPTTWNDLN